MKEGIPIETEDLQEEEDHKIMGDPQIDMEDPLMEEDPLTMEGHLIEMEDQDAPDRRGPPGPRGAPGPIRPVIVQQPQVVLDTTTLENTFDNMGQSMLQLARVQDQTNRHLQQHIQQGQLNMQAHAGALHQLANSTHQRNYDSYLCKHLHL